jgi:hypothetical protein
VGVGPAPAIPSAASVTPSAALTPRQARQGSGGRAKQTAPADGDEGPCPRDHQRHPPVVGQGYPVARREHGAVLDDRAKLSDGFGFGGLGFSRGRESKGRREPACATNFCYAQ